VSIRCCLHGDLRPRTNALPALPLTRPPRYHSLMQDGRGEVILALALILAAVNGGCRRKAMPPPPAPAVTVARPLSQEVIEWDEYTGHLEAVETVELRARISGLVFSTPFQEGAIVKKDELLVEIDVQPFEADLESKIAAEQQASAQVDLALITYDHLKELMPMESASPIEFKQSEASLRQARAAVAGAQAAVKSARLNVEWCRIMSPIAGRISRKFVTEGNLVTGGTGTGTLLTTITSIDPIYCYVDADEHSVLKYQKLSREGKRVSARDAQIPCFLQLSNETGFSHEGVVDFVDNRLDPLTGTIRARGVFPNSSGWLTPGFFGRLRLPGSGRYQALLVPDSAITTDQNEKQLLVVGADDVVHIRRIKQGALFGDLRAIASGITPQERIVINGQMNARAEEKVTPQETQISSSSYKLTSPGSPTTQALPSTEPTTAKSQDGSVAETRKQPPLSQPTSQPLIPFGKTP
jgi:RND family efflux transporter MFP subunit